MKMQTLPELTLFFPCYNEGSNIANTVDAALPVLKKTAKEWEILLINDGSKDDTLDECKKLVKKYGTNLKVINHPVNRGYGAALKSGFYGAKYDWIAFIDADGQFDFSEISKLIEVQAKTNSDMVVGYYLKRQVPFLRIIGSSLWQLAVFILFGLRVKDIDCGFKLFKKEIFEKIPKLESERGPFITSEYLIKARKAGFKISEIGVHHFERQAGHATGSDLNVIIAGFRDLFRLWVKENFQK